MYIKVHAVPGSKKEKMEKESDNTYRIMVREPAQQNLANHRIRELLCLEYGLEKGDIQIVSGHRSPKKIFTINN